MDKANKTPKRLRLWWPALLTLLLLVIGFIIYILTPQNVNFRLASTGLSDGDRKVVLRAVSLTDQNEVLYQGEMNATSSQGVLDSSLAVPDELKNRAYIAEICTTVSGKSTENCFSVNQVDNSPEDETPIYSCPYYVAEFKPSKLSNFFNRNEVSIDNRLFCDGFGTNPNQKEFESSSRIDLAKKIEPSGLAALEDGIIVKKDGKLSVLSLEKIISKTDDSSVNNEIKNVNNNNYNNYFTQVGSGQSLVLSGDVLSLTGANSVTLPADKDTTYSAANGLKLGGTIFSINAPTCSSSSEKLIWNGSAFTCEGDVDTKYLAGDGLVLSGNTFSLDQQGANDGQVLMWSNADNKWIPQTPATFTNTDTQDLGLNTTAGTGNVVNEYEITLVDGGSVTLQDTDTDDQTISLTGNTLSLQDGGSVDLAPYLDNTDNQQLSLAGNTLSLTNGGSVTLPADQDTTYTAGSGLALNNTVFSVDAPTCSATQKLSWDGSAFQCVADIDTTVADDQTLSYNPTTGQLTIADGNSITIPLNTDTQDLSITNTAGTGNVVNNYTISLVDGGSVSFQDTDTKYTAGDGLSLSGSNVFSVDAPLCTDLQMLYWNGTEFECRNRNHEAVIMPLDLNLAVADVGAGGNGTTNMHRRNYIAVAPDGQGFIHLDFRMKNDTGGVWNTVLANFDSSWDIQKLSEIQTHEGGAVFAGYAPGVVNAGAQLIGGHRYIVNIPVFVNLP